MNNVEIERTYICNDTFDIGIFCNLNTLDKSHFDYLLTEHYLCEQYYISKTDDEEIRLRKYEFPFSDDDIYSEVTIKTGQGIMRSEVNTRLSYGHYDYILHSLKDIPEVKRKEVWEFVLNDGSVIFFNIVNNGKLKYIDVEFPNEAMCKDFNINEYVPKIFIKEEMNKSKPKEYIQKEGEN